MKTLITTRLTPICLAALGAIALGLVASTPARAAAVGAPQGLDLYITGQVKAHCGFQTPPASSIDLHELSQGGSATVGFTMNCNTPFLMFTASSNGALLGDKPAASGFANRLPYTVGLSVNTDLGAPSFSQDASTLPSNMAGNLEEATPGSLSSGYGVAIGTTGAVTISWQPQSAATPLIAGTYRDTLTIIVGART